MELKRAKVIMLPTNVKTLIMLNTYINETHSCSPLVYGATSIDVGTVEEYEDRGYKFQHLYFTSDDPINTGDWFLNYSEDIGYYPCQLAFGEPKGKKIIATTDVNILLDDKRIGKPTKSFIKKYCEKGGIDEVMIEYDLSPNDVFFDRWVVKIDSHNTITTRPIKTSWNREEVIGLIDACVWATGGGMGVNQDDIDDWIEKHLK